MAKVEMDLAELKQLEKKIEILELEKQDLIDKQHQVIVHHKYFNGKISIVDEKKVPCVKIHGTKLINNPYSYNPISYAFDEIVSLDKAIANGYIRIDLTEDSSRHTKDYINMSETVSQIREEVFNELSKEINSYKSKAIVAELELESIASDSLKDIERLKKEYNGKIEKIIEENTDNLDKLIKEKDVEIKELKDQLSKLSEEFKDFKQNKKRLLLEQELIDLKSQLENYKNKSFWKRVFNK